MTDIRLPPEKANTCIFMLFLGPGLVLLDLLFVQDYTPNTLRPTPNSQPKRSARHGEHRRFWEGAKLCPFIVSTEIGRHVLLRVASYLATPPRHIGHRDRIPERPKVYEGTLSVRCDYIHGLTRVAYIYPDVRSCGCCDAQWTQAYCTIALPARTFGACHAQD
jgi:hypothetical protein